MKTYDDTWLKQILKEANQEHLIGVLDALAEEDRQKLALEILSLDLSIFERAKHLENKTYDTLAPIPIFSTEMVEKERKELEEIGLSAIKKGKIGVVLLAGGQGTRLGFNRAKGIFNIGITKEISIFSRHFAYLCEIARKADFWFPIYVMTSIHNRAEIEAYLHEKNYFGYEPSAVYFFTQKMAPATDFSGKIYLETPSSLVLAPDGNGGWYHSFVAAGYADEAKRNGLEWLNIVAIDNVLQKTADPIFVGATLRADAGCGAKVVRKVTPDEKIGLICENEGHPSVIEYYELDKLQKERSVSTEGMEHGVILNYLFRTSELEKTITAKLPVHKARKKIPYYDGEYHKPETENGYKYEMLATDLVERMTSCLAFEIEREKEFAPIKNRTGIDSVESAREMLIKAGVEL